MNATEVTAGLVLMVLSATILFAAGVVGSVVPLAAGVAAVGLSLGTLLFDTSKRARV